MRRVPHPHLPAILVQCHIPPLVEPPFNTPMPADQREQPLRDACAALRLRAPVRPTWGHAAWRSPTPPPRARRPGKRPAPLSGTLSVPAGYHGGMTDWATLYTTVAAALLAWDAHCPADDRPAVALAAIQRYAAEPTPAHRQQLAGALAGVQAAWLAVVPLAGADDPAGAARAASAAALAVLCLGQTLLTRGADAARYRRTALAHARRAALVPPAARRGADDRRVPALWRVCRRTLVLGRPLPRQEQRHLAGTIHLDQLRPRPLAHRRLVRQERIRPELALDSRNASGHRRQLRFDQERRRAPTVLRGPVVGGFRLVARAGPAPGV